eukprot:CAMPEP_0206464638 /NCGR_PEP_ID=MMETSP0324_2-20121206/27335_1 /ASSEMBLY_ACC=CAM_ASM_000836 /TAXON_ID=2866 /ORGANISM="Crypthecodinium cohnii, Strain Seligo" /LENGTH=79 /DNA_ID=CAMNT_0053937307 /DNA_START=200 /DNA_END=437 /DNA_ORIENTATION=-
MVCGSRGSPNISISTLIAKVLVASQSVSQSATAVLQLGGAGAKQPHAADPRGSNKKGDLVTENKNTNKEEEEESEEAEE